MHLTPTRSPMPEDADPSGLRTLLALASDGLWVVLALILALALAVWLGAPLMEPIPANPSITG